MTGDHRPPDEVGRGGMADRFAMWRVPVTGDRADARVVVRDNAASPYREPLSIMLRAEKIHPDDVPGFVEAMQASAAWVRERT